MKKIILFVIASLLLIGCNAKEEKQDIKDKPITDLSIYNLPEKWTNQDGKNIELKELRGKVLVMVMIYTSCKSACPRLVADMRNIEAKIPEEYKDVLEKVDFGTAEAYEGTGAIALDAPSEWNGWFYQKPLTIPDQAGRIARFYCIGQMIPLSFRRHSKGTGITGV